VTKATRAVCGLLAGCLVSASLALGGCTGSTGGSGDSPVDQIDRARDVGNDVDQRQSDLEQQIQGVE